MRTAPAAIAAAAAVLLAVAGCSSNTPQGPLAEQAEYEQNQPTPATTDPMAPVQVGLDETHDFGGGFTIEIVDLRREVAEDGYNAVTGEEGDLPYVAWKFKITNNTGKSTTTGNVTNSCYVGDPLEQAEQPNLGDSLNPPPVLQDGQSAAWDADCWMGEDQSQLQFTMQFYDEQSIPLYPQITFAGDVE